MNRRIIFPILAFCLLSAVVYLTISLISPPKPLPADVPATEFSADRAMADLAIIGNEPRPMGESPARAAARDYLLDEIRALGLEPQIQDTFGMRVVDPKFVIGGEVENILVRLPGTDPTGAILLIAHYDSTPGGPGAGDNGSGVVTLLELLRALKAHPPQRQHVIFLFADGHEPGIIGTHAFVAQHPWAKEVKLVINMDTLRDGPATINVSVHRNAGWVQALAQSRTRPAAVSLPFHLFPGGDTDVIPFIPTGVAAVTFRGTAGSPVHHTTLDVPSFVNPSTIQQTGDRYWPW